jgi:hypothetical protein
MAALPPNTTDRYFFHYQNSLHSHTVVVRTATGVAYATVEGALESALTLVTGAYCASEGISVDFQLAGTDFSVPVSSGDWPTYTWGSDPAAPESDAVPLNFQGRSAGGHKCRLGVFGYKNAFSAFKLTGGEASAIEDFVAILNSTTGVFLAIDGLAPNWYSYANIKPNDYWVRQARA